MTMQAPVSSMPDTAMINGASMITANTIITMANT